MIEPSTEFGYRDLEVIQKLRAPVHRSEFVAVNPKIFAFRIAFTRCEKPRKARPALVRELDRSHNF